MATDLQATAGIAAAIVSLLGYPIYALDLLGPGEAGWRRRLFLTLRLRGGTAPRLVSWVIWAAVQGVIYSGARELGAEATNWLPLAYFLGCAGISALALRFGERRIGVLDAVCGAMALASLALLLGADDAFSALCLAILTDTLASVPTLVAVWREPRGESLPGWVCFLAGGLLNFLALPTLDPRGWSFETAGYTCVVVLQQAYVVGRIMAAGRLREPRAA
jgi:hypothetical protein